MSARKRPSHPPSAHGIRKTQHKRPPQRRGPKPSARLPNGADDADDESDVFTMPPTPTPTGVLVYVTDDAAAAVAATAIAPVALGFERIVVLQRDALAAWLAETVEASPRGTPCFVLADCDVDAMSVLRVSHVPAAALRHDRQFPSNREEFGVFQLQACTWLILKDFSKHLPATQFGEAPSLAAAIRQTTDAVQRAGFDDTVHAQVFLNLFPFAMTLLAQDNDNDDDRVFTCMHAKIDAWAWETRPTYDAASCSTSPWDIVHLLGSGTPPPEWPVPRALHDAHAPTPCAVAARNVCENLVMEIAEELRNLLLDTEERLKLPRPFTSGTMPPRPPDSDMTWGALTEFITHAQLHAPLQGGTRTYEINIDAETTRARVLSLCAVLEAMHTAPVTLHVASTRRVGADMATALTLHMHRMWTLRCMHSPSVIASSKAVGATLRPPLYDLGPCMRHDSSPKPAEDVQDDREEGEVSDDEGDHDDRAAEDMQDDREEDEVSDDQGDRAAEDMQDDREEGEVSDDQGDRAAEDMQDDREEGEVSDEEDGDEEDGDEEDACSDIDLENASSAGERTPSDDSDSDFTCATGGNEAADETDGSSEYSSSSSSNSSCVSEHSSDVAQEEPPEDTIVDLDAEIARGEAALRGGAPCAPPPTSHASRKRAHDKGVPRKSIPGTLAQRKAMQSKPQVASATAAGGGGNGDASGQPPPRSGFDIRKIGAFAKLASSFGTK